MARAPRIVNIPLLAALGLLGACAYLPPLPERPRDVFTTPVIPRGHAVPEETLAQITPNVSTRQDVQALLGSPSHSSTFSDESWYYISARTQQRPARNLAVRDQQVVVVDFAANGTVTGVRRINQGEMPRVDYVSRETPTPGTERSLLQALFGNIGRLGPGGAGAGATGGGPGLSAGSVAR